jgi:aerobic-type carbon monoxide dehydrogenase small subunit (CoxS/CutS family)
MASFQLEVNGEDHSVDVDPETPLLWVLRDVLNLTGTKYGCGQGLCGNCTVLIDGSPARSCLTAVSQAAGKSVTTIEGLSPDRSHALQKAWIAEEASQCGYCSPGQIMVAAGLLQDHPNPTDADIDEAMSMMICRCGSYQRIRQAIKRAAQEG